MGNRIEIIFFKYPVKGKVKTRLAYAIGDCEAFNLYRHFLTDILTTSQQVAADKVIALALPATVTINRELLNGFSFFLQQGSDLGERIEHAFRNVLHQGYDRAVLIGGDCPDLPAETIDNAFELLDTFDVVIGPSFDGGYYLIALHGKSLSEYLFSEIPWSTDSVLEQTLVRVKELGLSCTLLEEREDIDDIGSLKRFYCRNSLNDVNDTRLHTMKYLKKNREVVDVKKSI